MSFGALVVIGGAIAYVVTEAIRARSRGQPAAPAIRHALRAVALPTAAALISLAAVSAAAIVLGLLVIYLIIAALVVAFAGDPGSLTSTIATLAVVLIVTVLLAVAALALGGASLVRTWLRKRPRGPG
ncbi:MAG: hypothetical protein M3N98_00270 [Actinomycetota bacterium]|nr:hypothetical protein [Actinomycetota bacterium]